MINLLRYLLKKANYNVNTSIGGVSSSLIGVSAVKPSQETINEEPHDNDDDELLSLATAAAKFPFKQTYD